MSRTLRDAFAHFNDAVAANPVWAWAAQSPDGKTVVVTMWRDLLHVEDGHLVFEVGPPRTGEDWDRRRGHSDRTAKLRYVQDHCGNQFQGLIVEAANPSATVKSIRRIYRTDRSPVMRLERFDRERGTFTARSVEPFSFDLGRSTTI